MDLTFFIQNKHLIEVAEKPGLYAIMQSHLPRPMQAFRCGLAGSQLDQAAKAFGSKEASFVSRFATYLNYWLPTDGKVYACLTVPRNRIPGFAERVLKTEPLEGDNREEYQHLHDSKTLIKLREEQYHRLLTSGSDAMLRLGLPNTPLDKRKSEFFRGPLDKVIKSLKQIGTGDLYLFSSNNIKTIKKIKLRRFDETATKQIKLRESPRLLEVEAATPIVEALAKGDSATTKALNKLRDVTLRDERRQNREALRQNALVLETQARNLTPRQINSLQQIRRSPRLNP